MGRPKKSRIIVLLNSKPTLGAYYSVNEKNLIELERLIIKVRALQIQFITYLLDLRTDPNSPKVRNDAPVITQILTSHHRLVKKLNGTIKKHLEFAYYDSYNLILNATTQDDFFFKELGSRVNPDKIYATWATWDKHVRRLTERNRRIFSIAQLIVKKRLFRTLYFFFVHRNSMELGHLYPSVKALYFSIKPDLTWQRTNTDQETKI
jgi:hypothetical protein